MKERLTGAIILVALIVLLVPELLTGPVRTKSARTAVLTVALPPAARTEHAEPPLRTYSLTLGGLQPDQPTGQAPAIPAAQTPPQPAAGPPQSAMQIPAQAGAPQQAEESGDAGSSGLQVAQSPAHPAIREARSSASSGGWVVQLGSFASRRNADRLAHSLTRRGFRMSVSPAKAGARVLWRVRAGPAHDRAGAQHLAARLRALGHRGELLPVR